MICHHYTVLLQLLSKIALFEGCRECKFFFLVAFPFTHFCSSIEKYLYYHKIFGPLNFDFNFNRTRFEWFSWIIIAHFFFLFKMQVKIYLTCGALNDKQNRTFFLKGKNKEKKM